MISASSAARFHTSDDVAATELLLLRGLIRVSYCDTQAVVTPLFSE